MATFMLLLMPMLNMDKPPEWHGSFRTLDACVKAADKKNFNAHNFLNDPQKWDEGWRFICAELRPAV